MLRIIKKSTYLYKEISFMLRIIKKGVLTSVLIRGK